jgi:hypothetical protein
LNACSTASALDAVGDLLEVVEVHETLGLESAVRAAFASVVVKASWCLGATGRGTRG